MAPARFIAPGTGLAKQRGVMETLPSLASGFGGRPLGTERPSAIFPTATSPTSTGKMFADEVARADARARGQGLQARRLDELDGARRAARRATFGEGRDSPGAARPGMKRSDAPRDGQALAIAEPPRSLETTRRSEAPAKIGRAHV